MLILPIFDPSLFHKKATNIFSENCTFVSRIAKAEHLESINVFYPLNAQPKEKNETKKKKKICLQPTANPNFHILLIFNKVPFHGYSPTWRRVFPFAIIWECYETSNKARALY